MVQINQWFEINNQCVGCYNVTCSGGDCITALFRWTHRTLNTGGGNLHYTSIVNMFRCISVIMIFFMFFNSSLLVFLPPLFSPSLNFRMIVRICTTALAVKVIDKNLFFLFNDLNVIILIINNTGWGCCWRLWLKAWLFPRRWRSLRKFWWRAQVRERKVQT